jgi:cyanate permease
VLLGGVWLLYCAFGLTTTVMAPLVPAIKGALGLSDTAMGAVLGAWPLVYIAAAVPCGALLDRVGPRYALLLAAAIMALSSLGRAFAFDHATLFAAVALFGLGGPLISIGAPKLVSQWFTGPDRGLAMGIYITGPSVGAILALSLTNSVLMPAFNQDWRLVLVLIAGVSILAGAVWFALNLHPAAAAMVSAGTRGRGQGQLGIFVDLLKLPVVRLLLLMSVGVFFYNHGLNSWLPEILRRGGLSAAEAGYWAAIPTAVGIMGSLAIPRLAVPARRFVILLILLAGAGLAALALLSPAGSWLGVLGLVLQGLIRGSLMTILMLTLVESRGVGTERAGAAGGLFFSAAEVGGVLGPLTLGLVADASGGFNYALYLLAAICAALLLALRRLQRLSG